AARATLAEAEANREREAALKARDKAEAAGREADKQRAAVQRERDVAVAEKKRANEEAAISLAVKDYLYRGVIGHADPFNQIGAHGRFGRDLKMRDALDQAARSLAGRFARQPQIEVAVRSTIGDAYRGLGEHAKAREQLDAAVALSRKNV